MGFARSSGSGALVLALLASVPVAATAKPAVGKAAPSATLAMKQMTITVDPAGEAKATGEKIAAFQSATLGIFSCGDVADVARDVGATVETNDRLPFAALPPTLQATVRTMKVGTATQIFGDRQTGKVSVLVLCAWN